LGSPGFSSADLWIVTPLCGSGLIWELALFRRQELVHHDATVVVNDSPTHATVVIFAMEARAPTRELDATRDKVVVVILVMFAV
jgi:hypothetical protein